MEVKCTKHEAEEAPKPNEVKTRSVPLRIKAGSGRHEHIGPPTILEPSGLVKRLALNFLGAGDDGIFRVTSNFVSGWGSHFILGCKSNKNYRDLVVTVPKKLAKEAWFVHRNFIFNYPIQTIPLSKCHEDLANCPDD
ncbi:hypothetical protein EVAR_100964_1 [Eumeta japonica]|uniref:Uncharacterized protein n=1 Tax=Eumeta variegata TaxID=151549 RepID=A0A4C2ACQ7_EUMVA|nr:hypothetical protein EVAR_100964_1 [Eumeta japonica]